MWTRCSPRNPSAGCTGSRWRLPPSAATGSCWRGATAGRGWTMVEMILLFRDALYGTLVIAVTCGILGVWVVLRRIVFVGAALAQLSSAGIALALALAFTLLGAVFFGVGGQRQLVPPEATIGVTYAVAGAVGVLLISKAA